MEWFRDRVKRAARWRSAELMPRAKVADSSRFGAWTAARPMVRREARLDPTQSPVQVCTFPLRFKLASDMADDLRQILLGRPGNEAKPSNSNQEIIVTAPPDVMSRARTFITVMDWPDRIKPPLEFRVSAR